MITFATSRSKNIFDSFHMQKKLKCRTITDFEIFVRSAIFYGIF